MTCIKDMLSSIAATGLTQSEIAERIGVSQPTVYRAMRSGSDVGYEVGKKIEKLYGESCQKKAA